MPLCLLFKGKKLPEDPGADTVDFPKRTTPAKGMLSSAFRTQMHGAAFPQAVWEGVALVDFLSPH